MDVPVIACSAKVPISLGTFALGQTRPPFAPADVAEELEEEESQLACLVQPPLRVFRKELCSNSACCYMHIPAVL